MTRDPTGRPWDLAGSVETYQADPPTFRAPAELARAMARRAQVHGCFARAAVEWALGRHLVPADAELLREAADAAVRTGGRVAVVLEAIVAAPGFVNVVVAR